MFDTNTNSPYVDVAMHIWDDWDWTSEEFSVTESAPGDDSQEEDDAGSDDNLTPRDEEKSSAHHASSVYKSGVFGFSGDGEIESYEEWGLDIDDFVIPDEFFDNAIYVFDDFDELWMTLEEAEKDDIIDSYTYDEYEHQSYDFWGFGLYD